LAQVARYFSQAHLYLKGTSWLTSVWPLMMRLSAALMRRGAAAGDAAADAAVASAPVKEGIAVGDAGLTCSSQDNIKNSSSQIMKASAQNSKKRFTFSMCTTVKCCSIASHLACHSKVQCFSNH
jgi:hypothetical protein